MGGKIGIMTNVGEPRPYGQQNELHSEQNLASHPLAGDYVNRMMLVSMYRLHTESEVAEGAR